MDEHSVSRDVSEVARAAGEGKGRREGWQAPRFEVISLSCEISAYAPDGGDSPLF
jgi:hypothetical protein